MDTARTLTRLTLDAREHGATEVKTATLLNKHVPRKVSDLQAPDFVGLQAESGDWLYGFGMNRGFDGETEEDELLTRDLPEIYIAHGQPTLAKQWRHDWQVIPYTPRPDRLNFLLVASEAQRAQDSNELELQSIEPGLI